MNVNEAWRVVMHALQAATGTIPDCDDEGMRSADDEDLIGWADDLEARCGYNVTALRAAMSNYMGARAQFGG